MAYVETAAYAESGLPAGATLSYRVSAVNGGGLSAESATAEIQTLTPLVIPCFAAGAGGGAAVARGGGMVILRLSGALDPRLELVCSDTLERPVAGWSPVSNAAFTGPEAGSGVLTVSIMTNAPKLFFAVRVK